MSFWERLSIGMDLPGESLPTLPLIEIVGEHRVLVENHKGVIGYSDGEICVKVKFGFIRISGSQLMLSKLTKQQLVISGFIDSVSLCRG